jgi:hypothetical protein
MDKDGFIKLGQFSFKAITNEGTKARYEIFVYAGGIIVHKIFLWPPEDRQGVPLQILRRGKNYILYRDMISFKLESLATILMGVKEVYESQGNESITQQPGTGEKQEG